ncbi:hypothetical protein [Streptomyces sp. WAC05858]|uniref:hypothetical protein n=1 Tax=Streptomyces TaxID=1883 RepID=UPI000F78855C|nr:hypothetical protein [Streptomyces sp. WAC05858]RSS37947.1 hypothetical protein EF902_31605 [Streptomyces sp. WAC05858]
MQTTTRQSNTEIARFRTLVGRLRNDFLRVTRVARTDTGQYEIECAACGQGHRHGTFKFQSDATDAARAHANRCVA